MAQTPTRERNDPHLSDTPPCPRCPSLGFVHDLVLLVDLFCPLVCAVSSALNLCGERISRIVQAVQSATLHKAVYTRIAHHIGKTVDVDCTGTFVHKMRKSRYLHRVMDNISKTGAKSRHSIFHAPNPTNSLPGRRPGSPCHSYRRSRR